MRTSICFTRVTGGYVVKRNRALAAMIFEPKPAESKWRVITENVDGEYFTAEAAKIACSESLILDLLEV